MGKFFTVEVKPTIAASKQALGAFADNDLVFDWTSFDIPSGASKLVNATVVARGTDGVAQSFALNMFFAKTLTNGTAPGSLGTIHATANGTGYQNHLIGAIQQEEVDILAGPDILFIGGAANATRYTPALVLDGEPGTGTNVGYDKLYIGATTLDGEPNFASTVQNGVLLAAGSTDITAKTTSALTTFDKNDVLHDEDDQVVGTIKEITSATAITLKSGSASTVALNKDFYCINPITIILSFER